jgi:hypothetical protein
LCAAAVAARPEDREDIARARREQEEARPLTRYSSTATHAVLRRIAAGAVEVARQDRAQIPDSD